MTQLSLYTWTVSATLYSGFQSNETARIGIKLMKCQWSMFAFPICHEYILSASIRFYQKWENNQCYVNDFNYYIINFTLKLFTQLYPIY